MKSNFEGVVFFPLNKFHDDRGWLCELFRSDELWRSNFPEMGYVSETLPGVVRGPHEHETQSDYFAFIGPGNFVLSLWEKRTGGVELEEYHVGQDNSYAVIVPPGIVHAYQNISQYPGWVFNGPNQLYAGPGKKYPVDETRHEDVGTYKVVDHYDEYVPKCVSPVNQKD